MDAVVDDQPAPRVVFRCVESECEWRLNASTLRPGAVSWGADYVTRSDWSAVLREVPGHYTREHPELQLPRSLVLEDAVVLRGEPS